MVKVLEIDIYMVDDMIDMGLDEIGTDEEIKWAQIDYLKSCPYEIRYQLIKIYRQMNFETSKMDDEILAEIIEYMESEELPMYDYYLISE